MNDIFEIKDKTGRTIKLSKERWKHIVTEHPNISNCIEQIKETLAQPLVIKKSDNSEEVKFYYKQSEEKNKYLFVVVKYLN